MSEEQPYMDKSESEFEPRLMTWLERVSPPLLELVLPPLLVEVADLTVETACRRARVE